MKLKAEREIERINRYEKKWKISTSEEKFKIIPMAQYKTQQLSIDGKNINTKRVNSQDPSSKLQVRAPDMQGKS